MHRLFMLFLWLPLVCWSQYTIFPLIPGQTTENTGLIYALPKNTLEFTFVIEHQHITPGPFAQYAKELLGVTPPYAQVTDLYYIKDVAMSITTGPDKEALFRIVWDTDDLKDQQLSFSINEKGIITGSFRDMEPEQKSRVITEKYFTPESITKFGYYASRNQKLITDTIIRKITIDTTTIYNNLYPVSWTGLTPKEKAEAAVEQLERIRENRFLLISGYQEVNFGNSMEYMDRELKKLETEYLGMFLGHKQSALETYVVHYTPESGQAPADVLMKFSENSGPMGRNGTGTDVTIRFAYENLLESVKSSPTSLRNAVYYRYPVDVRVEVLYQGKVLLSKNQTISQLGRLISISATGDELRINPESGILESIVTTNREK